MSARPYENEPGFEAVATNGHSSSASAGLLDDDSDFDDGSQSEPHDESHAKVIAAAVAQRQTNRKDEAIMYAAKVYDAINKPKLAVLGSQSDLDPARNVAHFGTRSAGAILPVPANPAERRIGPGKAGGETSQKSVV